MVAVDEVPGFVRTVYTLLRVCDDSIIGWSEDGTQILIKEPDRFAAEVCPKFFRHRNFNSFTRSVTQRDFLQFLNLKSRRWRLHETAPPRRRRRGHMRVDAYSRRRPCHAGSSTT